MNILAIDTTTKKASVSIQENDKLYMVMVDNEITHSEKLLPLIDKVISKTNLNIKDMSILACINGPGSFTGIRIGLATIKALAQVNNLDIFSISSLELIAFKTHILNPKAKHVISMISTNNDRIFYCLYKTEKINGKVSITQLTDINNDFIDDAIHKINSISNTRQHVFIAGNCINYFEKELSALDIPKFDIYPNTNDCIEALQNINNFSKYTFNAFSLNAIYARPSQAERMKNEKN